MRNSLRIPLSTSNQRPRTLIAALPMRQAITFTWLVALLLTLVGCSGEEATDLNKIHIGLIVDIDTTGGPPSKNAAELYWKAPFFDDILSIEKRPQVELHIEEISSRPDIAREAARRLIFEKKVIAIIGANVSLSAMSVAAVAETAKVPFISPGATNSKVSDKKQFVFQLPYNDLIQGRALADLVAQRLNKPKIAVLYEISDPSIKATTDSFISAYLAQGGVIGELSAYPFGKKEFHPFFQSVIDHRYDWVLLPNSFADTLSQANQMRALGYTGRFIGTDAWGVIESQYESSLQQSIFSHHWHPALAKSSELNQRFVNWYAESFGKPPSAMAALTFDSFYALEHALIESDRQKSNLQSELSKINHLHGLTGIIDLTREKNNRKPIYVRVHQMRSEIFTEISAKESAN